MPIEFHCTQCGKLLRTPDDSAGKQAKCPECGTVLGVPAAPTGATPPASQPSYESFQPPPRDPSTGPTYPDQPLKASPASRVAAPAIALMVTAGLGLFITFVGFIFQLGGLAIQQQNANDQFAAMFSGTIGLISGAVHVAITGLIIFGAIKMKNLSSYGLALTGAILGVVPCITPCCGFLTMPFGIWALVVLLDNDVKQAFVNEVPGQFLP